MTFMAKPLTAAALCLCGAVFLLLSGKLDARFLAVSLVAALVLLLASAWIIDGSVQLFIGRLQEGKKLAGVLGGGHTVEGALRLDTFRLSRAEKYLLAGGTLAVSAVALLSQSRNRYLNLSGDLLSAGIALSCLAIVSGLFAPKFSFRGSQRMLIWAIPFAASVTGIFLMRSRSTTPHGQGHWPLALCFLMFPHAYAFGTNINYWQAGAGAGIFWVLAGLVVLSSFIPVGSLPRILLPLGLGAQLITVVLLQYGMENPYRQPQPIWKNDLRTVFGRHGSRLVLPRGYGEYVAEATRLAGLAGFQEGTPMIDMTGQSPGVLYAMGASSVGQAWTIGGYPGSDNLAVAMLNRVSCDELARAWLLNEPDGPRRISPSVLESFGADLSSDYELVAALETPIGAGGYDYARSQQILKPVRSFGGARSTCMQRRERNR
jgi:hypothetical protein